MKFYYEDDPQGFTLDNSVPIRCVSDKCGETEDGELIFQVNLNKRELKDLIQTAKNALKTLEKELKRREKYCRMAQGRRRKRRK